MESPSKVGLTTKSKSDQIESHPVIKIEQMDGSEETKSETLEIKLNSNDLKVNLPIINKDNAPQMKGDNEAPDITPKQN